jgi:hypothetical protein
MEISVNLHMQLINLIRFILMGCIKQKNVKISGIKDIVYTELDANFYIQNAKSVKANQID